MCEPHLLSRSAHGLCHIHISPILHVWNIYDHSPNRLSNLVMAHVHLNPIAGDGCFEPAFASHLLGSLGRGASSCKELQEAAASMVIESGGNCSH